MAYAGSQPGFEEQARHFGTECWGQTILEMPYSNDGVSLPTWNFASNPSKIVFFNAPGGHNLNEQSPPDIRPC